MSLKEEIEFWERAAMKTEKHESALLFMGIIIGLKLARRILRGKSN